ncbi:MAG: hypothetical protein KGH79_02590 [Patescibacteria group bacterium]|nr:hypothetical protein [Patescibacteria group bacterium]
MSTSTDERLAELRRKAFPYLPGSDFDEALAEAKKYHENHPPYELILETQTDFSNEKAREAYKRFDLASRRQLAAEHRERTMRPFRERDVPQDLAGEIVDELVLQE